MSYELKNFSDPRILSFFLDNLKNEKVTYEEYKGGSSPSFYFFHKHKVIDILKPPTRGTEKNISRDGRILNYKFGDAVPDPKNIHAVYCNELFLRKNHNSDLIHPLENKTLFYEGQEVIARWDPFGYFFLGKIREIFDASTADIKFKNGQIQLNLPYRYILAIKRRKIEVGDFVMANILTEFDQDCWVPGEVEYIDYKIEPIQYHIVYYNGEKGVNLYTQLIKINEEQYLNYRNFICAKLSSKKKTIQDPNDSIPYEMIHEAFDGDLDIFGEEFQRLKVKYQPILQPSENYNSVITQQNDRFIKARKSLKELIIGDEVLAKWPDDCWYYPSVVKGYLGDYKYKVQNNLKAVKIIFREDLIPKSINSGEFYSIGETVLAAHPKYKFGYAPGEIVQLTHRLTKLVVRFYDYSQGTLDRNDVYRLDRAKFEHDIDSIIQLEKAWIGHSVFGYNFSAKTYAYGKIVGRLHNKRQYVLEWPDGKQTIQIAYFLFVPKSEEITASLNNIDNKSDIYQLDEKDSRGFLTREVKENKTKNLRSGYYKIENSDKNELYSVSSFDIKKEINLKENKNKSTTLPDRNRETPIINAKSLK